MRVTRSWLEEFIDLGDISNQRLYELFNSIGLEVDSLEQITIPEGVVVGKLLSCKKHPDADKLNVCQIDIGEESPKQIVCGAANVLEAEYVAVATVGTTLPGDFRIKPATLRGVESHGMVCSSTELGLPKINDGIMILDSSIGTLEIGRALNSYPKIADTLIELELTANRGDCLSIHGVARDLSAVLGRDIKTPDYQSGDLSKVAIARRFSLNNQTDAPVDLLYKLSQNDHIVTTLLIELRLGFVSLELSDTISNILQYSTHATGVILRAYDVAKLQEGDRNTSLTLEQSTEGLVRLKKAEETLSIIGVNQNSRYSPDKNSEEILFEASYIRPDVLIEAVANSEVEPDSLYYNTSRGSEPDLEFGMQYLEWQCAQACDCRFADSALSVEQEHRERVIAVNFEALDSIIGQETSKSEVSSILSRLGFHVNRTRGADSFGVTVPQHRHDIENIQDVAEEILRIIGINQIQAKPLTLTEQVRLTESTRRYRAKRDLRQRAVGRGFFEAVTYAFADRTKLEKYGFPVLAEELRLLNPIAEEFNTLRSTLLINLLDAVKRNVSYGMKRIPLFEIGTVFDRERQESERAAFVWSGQAERERVSNQGKAAMIDFASFVAHLSAVVGELTLRACESKNGLMHPYQSAEIIQQGRVVGFVSKLHPSAAEAYGIADTVIAELELEALMPQHITAQEISNYQGVYKDLSVVVEERLPFAKIEETLSRVKSEILKRFYPIDIYQDDSLGKQKSVTIRFYLQSMQETLSEAQIEQLMQEILERLADNCGATIR